MALDRVHGLHLAADLILQCVRLGENEWVTLVSAPLSNQLPNEPTQNPFNISTILDLSAEPSNIIFRTAQPHLHPLHREIHFYVFDQNSIWLPQSGGHPELLTKTPSGFTS